MICKNQASDEYLASQSFRNVVTFNRDNYTGHHKKEFKRSLQISIKQKSFGDFLVQVMNSNLIKH